MAEEKYDHVKRSRKEIISNNFLGGLAWGIGVTIGLAIFLAILAFIASRVDTVPLVGNYISDILNYLLQNGAQYIQK
ncbi:hypothetical protein E6Q11_04480 [Candidatus Dojkabacteria bacterium]|uniref:Uncharacterized protein n=1 Tax=Candidatus Dojkabacteria bacterium TaxID=2099670 RepID=A0A5C7J4T8_9BACT|nr:MAG: hypothetical protein E6Q11_04480 [Candidatus Dojkabacteria bacterium]